MRSLKLSLALSVISFSALAAGCADAGANANAAASSSSSSGTSGGQPSATTQPGASQSPAAVAGQPAGAGAQAAADGAKADACALLTSDDVKDVQGEPVKDSKASRRTDGSLSVSQCFFSTTTFNKSVSLEVTRGGAGTSARKFWDARFERAREEGGKGERERERERARERERERERGEREKKGERKGEEEEEESLPTPVKGIGDEAYWAASHVNGILYVLKGDAFIRVSIGGADDNATRLKKSKALAQKAISRL
ncbi:MAG TPA: hypothetical protein VM864_00720 [Pyrinomonadaceae bacterium]|jgi:hypothetical protein|nr:hypothetical protein [Pyrinomonadaceae bacterium]